MPIRSLFILPLLLLSACLTTNNRVGSGDDGNSAGTPHGIVLIGFDRAAEVGYAEWNVKLARMAYPEGYVIDYPTDGQAVNNHVNALFVTGSLWRGKERYAAFRVKPGTYALTEVGPYVPNPRYGGGSYYAYDPNMTVAGGLIGLGLVAVIGATAAIGEKTERDKFGIPPRPPLYFLSQGALVADAPRVTVREGEVVYIGDFKAGATIYEFSGQADQSGATQGFADDTSNPRVPSPFIEYLVDEPSARAALAEMDLAELPFRVDPMTILGTEPIHIDPRLSAERVAWRANAPIVATRLVHAPTSPNAVGTGAAVTYEDAPVVREPAH